MSKPFDATTRDLVAGEPASWLRFVDPEAEGTPTVIDSDLSTVVAEADKVLRVDDSRGPYIVHIEFQSGREPMFPTRLLRYNAMLSHRHQRPVLSGVVLLRPEADGPEMSGLFRQEVPGGRVVHEFRFVVVRVWRTPVETLLAGGLGTLPLAPISDLGASSAPEVLRRMSERLGTKPDSDHARGIWTSTYYLMGLRFMAEQTQSWFEESGVMRDSTTYQATLAQGRAEGVIEGRIEGELIAARKFLVRLGRVRLGEPSTAQMSAIEAFGDSARVEALGERVFSATSWDDLLANY